MQHTSLSTLRRLTLLAASALLSLAAQASVGLDELPGSEGDGPVTVFYPSSSAAVSRCPSRRRACPSVAMAASSCSRTAPAANPGHRVIWP